MNALKQIILWLALIVACWLPASALTITASENHVWEIFTVGYDAPFTEATDFGNRPETSTSDYDSAPIHGVATEANPTEVNRPLFGQNAEFKAAEGTPLILQNAANGNAFESSVISALGATKNTASITVDGLGTSIPDLIDASGNITEIKSGVNLYFTKQLQIQAQGAEGSLNLIVGPRTQTISAPLLNAVSAVRGDDPDF